MWSKLDDQFYLNPKNTLIDRDEQDLHIAAIVYASGQLTDGFIPVGVLPMLCIWAKISVANDVAIAKQVPEVCYSIATRLVEHCYWENAEGGYQIHDFLEYNPSREEVLELRNARKEAGRRGGLAKALAFAKQKPSKSSSKTLAKPYQNSSKIVPRSRTRTLLTTGGGVETTENIFAVYENEIGALTPMMRDELMDAENTYPAEWIVSAIGEAARQNKRNWKYILAILKRWKVEGFQSVSKPTPLDVGYSGTKADKVTANNQSVLQRAMERAEAEDGD